MNSVQIIGRVGTDIECKDVGGKPVASFRVAISEGKDQTTWLTVSAWERSAELCRDYVRKGDQIGVAGRISVREYTTKEGDKRTATEVVASRITLIGGKREPETEQPAPAARGGGYGRGR